MMRKIILEIIISLREKSMIHKSAEVHSKNIGIDTFIWQNCLVFKDAVIGKNCNINFNVLIENEVIIGDNVTIKPGVQIWDGIILEDNVFIGPNVTFTNDLIPRSKNTSYNLTNTTVRKGASIGANATIIAGNVIGEFAMIGAGAVLTKHVGRNELWIGNPAKHVGYITNDGNILDMNLKSKASSQQYKWNIKQIVKDND